MGTPYQLVEVQAGTRMRSGGHYANACASGCGDGNGILYQHSLPVLVLVDLRIRAQDQRTQAKEPIVVVALPPEGDSAVAYCA